MITMPQEVGPGMARSAEDPGGTGIQVIARAAGTLRSAPGGLTQAEMFVDQVVAPHRLRAVSIPLPAQRFYVREPLLRDALLSWSQRVEHELGDVGAPPARSATPG